MCGLDFILKQKEMNLTTAIKLTLGIVVAILLFHLSILFKVVPYEITWGGRLTNDFEMYVFETVSVLVNLFLLTLLMIKGKYWNAFMPLRIVNILLWAFGALFALNTVGNVLAKTSFEKTFAIITLALSFLICYIQIKTGKHHLETKS
ncbi:hypothetical protein Oweho_0277 [Owenweeksia hongkongensis DSM 17368]|uniref:Uncharacterized protein n=2 Tax=Owenweeksia TaxID=267986 RepID=G8R7X6_OWEHD|nr:hypothetical protein Oweho_0277 [Owenweeksia hongkongensis DSM 17368]